MMHLPSPHEKAVSCETAFSRLDEKRITYIHSVFFVVKIDVFLNVVPLLLNNVFFYSMSGVSVKIGLDR